jgi:hypothetical protein
VADDVIQKELEEIQREVLKLSGRLSSLLNLVQGEQAARRIVDRASAEDQKTLERVKRGAPLKLPEVRPAKRTLHDRILEVFYRQARGGETLTRHQVYYYSGCSPTSSGVNTAYADLFEDGLLLKVQGGASMTKAGFGYCSEAGFIAEPFPTFETFEAFVGRQNTNLQKILRAQRGVGRREWSRSDLCEAAGVSVTSSGTNTAIARLVHLDVAATGRGVVTFSDWYVKAIAPVVRAFDTKTGVVTRYDVETGKPR